MVLYNNDKDPYYMFIPYVLVGLGALLLAGCSIHFKRTPCGVSVSFAIIMMYPCTKSAPTGKKTSGHKKSHQTDEDSHSSRKTRKNHSSPLSSSQLTPKHMPFPQIPLDGEKLFEFMNAVFTLVALGLQYLNLYRTTWWMPNSNNIHAMNIHLISQPVTVFVVVLLTLRIGYLVFMAPLQWMWVQSYEEYIRYAFKMTLITVLFGQLFVIAFNVTINTPLLNCFFILYPGMVYLMLFGLETRPLFTLDNEKPAMHCCTNDPVLIREEIATLREHFNYRIKNILYCAFASAYYTSFLPCCYAQSFLNYHPVDVVGQAMLVFFTMFLRLSSHMLSSHYCDVMHRSTLHLGYWKLIPKDVEFDYPLWIPTKLYGLGSKVSYLGKGYVCVSKCAAGDPSVDRHRRFYGLFRNPSRIIGVLVYVQLAVILVQVLLLLTNLRWHLTLANTLILFMNYYSLFKLVRDYLITWKLYRAEYLIQQKPFEELINESEQAASK